MNAIHLKIDNIHRDANLALLKRALGAVPNVLAVQIRRERHEAVVQHKGTNVRALCNAIRPLGYYPTEPLA